MAPPARGASVLEATKSGTPIPAAKPLSKAVVFTTSGLGGILGWIVVHPFNTLAVRMNLSAGAGPPKSFGVFATELVKAEGVGSLYAGLSAGCLRQVFYATARLGLYETFRDMAAQYRKTDFAQRFALASVSGGCAALISCPVEVCLVRMSNDASMPAAERRGYTGVADAMMRIVKEEGVPAFFRGSQPFVYRAMVVGGTQVATYDQLKQACTRRAAPHTNTRTRARTPSIASTRRMLSIPALCARIWCAPQLYQSMGLGSGLLNQFASSLSAGLIYSLITMPLETAKNRMAFQTADPKTGKLPCAPQHQRARRRSALFVAWHVARCAERVRPCVCTCACSHGYDPDRAEGRGDGWRLRALEWLPALLRTVRRAHGDHVRGRRPDPHPVPEDGLVRRVAWCHAHGVVGAFSHAE